jgi:hypothetical protein
VTVTDSVIIQYVGFQVKDVVREYCFLVRDPPSEAREFKFSIGNEAFNAHRVRYQDAPDICSAKLRRELAASENNNPLETSYSISEVELDEYRGAHTSKSAGKLYTPKSERENF